MSTWVPPPPTGRRYTVVRPVHLGDAGPGGRLRLDALARACQDVADDDAHDAGLGDLTWVVRRVAVRVVRPAVYREVLSVATWCSGTGGRWAERRTSFAGDRGASIDVVALWVHVDAASGRPAALPERFAEVFGPSAQGRVVRPRLSHPDPPAGAIASAWPTRFCDFDVMGHVNNAAYWEAVEEALATRRDLRGAVEAEMEFRGGVDRGVEVAVVTASEGDTLWQWMVAEATTCASARVRSVRSVPGS